MDILFVFLVKAGATARDRGHGCTRGDAKRCPLRSSSLRVVAFSASLGVHDYMYDIVSARLTKLPKTRDKT